MKNDLKNSKTFLNLAKAFAGECQAHVRYKFIEYGARNEGYASLAEIIDKVVYQEFNHARMLYSFIETADKNVIENIPSNKNGTLKTILRLRPKTKKTKPTKFIRNI